MRQEATNDASRLPGWFPVKLRYSPNDATVMWRNPGKRRFREPFFEDTFRIARRDPDCVDHELVTPSESLVAFANTVPAVPPRGFIFHLSRCGSTLVSQMLAAVPRHVVISEAPVIDDVLQTGWTSEPVPPAARIQLLRLIVHALGQRRFLEERDLFIKFDAWHTLDLPLIQEAFPEVPWIFVYREPEEILVSHEGQPGLHMVPGLLPPGRFGGTNTASLAEYGAHVLASICGAVLARHRPDSGRLVHYGDLPGAMFTEIKDWFDLNLAPEEIQTLREATTFSAKQPSERFTPDRERKQALITLALRAIAEQHTGETYRRLEAARASAAVPIAT